MTTCCICGRDAAPADVGAPLCAGCRIDAAREGEARRAAAVDLTSGESVLIRYAQRLTLAQAPLRALTAMKPAGSA